MERAAEDDNDDLPWAAYVFAVWNLIIRPPRSRYSQSDLVAKYPSGAFRLRGQKVQRKDFAVANPRGLKLECTVFEPVLDGSHQERACVVYCHGNSASRLAGFELVPVFMSLNIALACFDFAGSGMSGGDYVSLGYHEQEDLGAVVQHLRAEKGFTRIGVWGYSMGAATALMYASTDASLAGVLADSPFGDLRDLIQDICCHQLNLPTFLLSTIMPIVRLAIQRKAAFDIYDVSPSKHVPSCFVPALFLHGDADDFISPSHSSLLESLYSGESMRLLMPSIAHASKRPLAFIERASVFFVRALRWEPFLPAGMTEEQLATRARQHMVSRAASPSQQRLPPLVKGQIGELLSSASRTEQGLGFVRAACELCAAYRGAELLPTMVINLGSGVDGKRCPVRFSGKVVLESDAAEVAICWSRQEAEDESCAACNGDAHRFVYFALLSPTAISLTRVTLAKITSLDAGIGMHGSTKTRANKTRSNLVAGLSCVSVEPLAFAGAALTPCIPHEVSLRVLSGGIELSAGGATASVAENWADDEVTLWCMHWRSGKVDCRRGQRPSATNTSVQLERVAEPVAKSARESLPSATRGPRILSTPGAAQPVPFEERLAERLATLCLDGDCSLEQCELSPAASDAFLFPDMDKACYRTSMVMCTE